MADQVQVYYWPTAAVNTNCARGAKISGDPTGPKYASNATAQATQSMKALNVQGGIDVIDGFTYTYPSTYISVVGKISVTNSCGAVGKTLTNPTPVAVQAITTASYASWPSTCRPQGQYVNVVIDILDINDIACPTWGLSDPFYTTCDGDVYLTATEGAPYNPVILVPTQFLNYDPAWGACAKAQTAGPFTLPCGLYDPPRTLRTQGGMMPEPTSPSDPEVPPRTLAPAAHQPETIMAPISQVARPSPTDQPAATTAPSPSQGGTPDSSPDHDPQAQSNPDPTSPGKSPQNSAISASNPEPNVQSQPSPQSDPKPQANSQSSPQSDTNSDSNSGSDSDPQANPQTNPQSNPQSNPQASPQSNPQNNPQTKPSSSGTSGSSQNPQGQPPAQPASKPQKPVVPPQPIPQTTVAIGSPQPSASIGANIYSAFGAGPPSSQPGASSSDAPGSSGASPSSGSGANSGGTGGNPGANSGGSPGGNPSSSPGDTQGAPAGGNSEGSSAGSPAPFTPHPVTILGQTLSAINPTAVAIAGKTLSAGGPAFSTSGNYYSVGPSGSLVAGTLTTAATKPPLLTFGGSTYTANSASQFVVGSQTLGPGQQITVSGTPISLSPSSNIAIVGSSTQSLASATSASPPALLTFGGSTYTANSASQFVIDSQTLTPGQQITVSGTPISEAPGGSYAVISGSTTQSLAVATVGADGSTITPQPALLTFGGTTYTANPSSSFIIDSQTLTPGGVITVSGTAISEAPPGSGLVVVGGSSTQVLSHAPAPGAPITAAVMTFAGQTYTADASGAFVIDNQTLTPGGLITVSGTPISEAPAATDVVIGGSTEVLSTATSSPSVMSFISAASGKASCVISGWIVGLVWSLAVSLATGWFALEL